MALTSTWFTSRDFFTAAAVVVSSLGLGYALGLRSGRRYRPQSKTRRLAKRTNADAKPPGEEINYEIDSDEEDEVKTDRELDKIRPKFNEPCKLVFVVRVDVGMKRGKMAAQCGHAAVACYKTLMRTNPDLVRHWEMTGQAKIALKAETEEHLMQLQLQAKNLNLCARVIRDAGRTQVQSGTMTVLGIGPGPVDLIDKVTGQLMLL